MPVGPLGLDSLVASDSLILHRGGERGMMDRSGDLGSCETSIKVKNTQMKTGKGREQLREYRLKLACEIQAEKSAALTFHA